MKAILEQPKLTERLEILEIERMGHMQKISDRELLKELPDNYSMFKCPHCRYIFDIFEPQCAPVLTILCDKENIICPNCGTGGVELICKVDAYSVFLKIYDAVLCRKGVVIPGVDICPVCGDTMCPECYNHSCVSLSRVTGYIQDISGWNIAKRQELLDRKRYDIDQKGDSKNVIVRANRIDNREIKRGPKRKLSEIDMRKRRIEMFDKEMKNRSLKEGQQYLNSYKTQNMER